ncbi:MAG: transposase [Bryobacteraceae bacterium]
MAHFDGGALTSHGGALLLREVERRIRLIEWLAACFDDHRNPLLVRHPIKEMIAQRLYGLALGTEMTSWGRISLLPWGLRTSMTGFSSISAML